MTDFIHTWSKLQTFETCPRQFEDSYVGPKKPFVQTEQIKWGNTVHSAMEDRVLGKELTPLPESMKPFQKYVDAAQVAQQHGLEVKPEWKLGMRRDGTPCDYWAKDVWMRAKVDLPILARNSALVQDYKTGKWKNEKGQLAMSAWLVFTNKPEVTSVDTRYLWLQGGDNLRQVYTREDQGKPDVVPLQKVVVNFTPRLARIEESIATGHFDPKPSGLCKKYCSVFSCEYNGRTE